MISEHTILSYFAQAQASGWALITGSLANGWHAKYGGRLRDYDVYLDSNDEWVYMQCALLMSEPDYRCKEALYEYLLRASDRMFLAKLTVFRADTEKGPADWVGITAECSVDGFNASMFRLMAEAIATYAEQYGREIHAIALSKDVAELARQRA